MSIHTKAEPFGTISEDAMDLRSSVETEVGAEIEMGAITLHLSNVQHGDTSMFSPVKINIDFDTLDRIVRLAGEL